VVYLPDSRKGDVHDFDAMQLTREFAMLASVRLGIDFLGNVSFLKGLKLHLNVALHRMRSGQVIKNPLTESIKYKYRFIFETCKQMIMQLEKNYELNFPDDEIAYIAMHVGACFEMTSQVDYLPKALVVCNSGLATSNLLATRLKVMLPELSILGPLGLSELTPELINQVDFVISTHPFSLTEKDLVVVNPLLGIDDVLALKKRVINITSKKQLSYLMLDRQAGALKLGDLLVADQIELQKRVMNWRSAIEVAAKSLVVTEIINKNYVKAIIEAVENFGPYMVFIPNIAIVHASPNTGVIKEGLSILTLDQSLVLGDTRGVSVRCFIVLATPHKESQLFINLISLLDSKNNIDKLLSSSSKQEVLQITNET
jgi:mannitol/fructose-specific phosphotransferase system IIA component (Ntr-type)